MTYNPKSGYSLDHVTTAPKRRPKDRRTTEQALKDLELLLDPPPPAGTLRYRLWAKRRKEAGDG